MLRDLTIRSLPAPTKGQKIYWDNELPAFGVRVSQGGTKSFILVLRDRWVTIGRYHADILPLSKARTEAKRILAEQTLGKIRPQSITYAQAVDLFLKDKAQAKRPSTVYGYRIKLARLTFKGQLADITHADAARKIDRIHAPSERSHVLVSAKVFFNWCIKRRYITDNPLVGLTKPLSTPRTRLLTDTELRALWRATGDFADYVKLLLLTAQRRGELHQATLEADTLHIAGTIAKNGREHLFPATTLAQSLWRPFPRFEWGKAKSLLDTETGTSGWTLHDIRRTVATRMAELGVAPHVIESILNHQSGVISPLARVYNRHNWLAEMRDAMNKWEARLRAIIGDVIS